ncbi:ferredoxin [Gorillibacterium massiliense]|uniref:ferredoxin n=1 Tax=Gorillibacterium massiliense TaxID=1280390 RepID=UPI0004B00FC2|nr:ferredoxin [Gorillibacterium massiliense]
MAKYSVVDKGECIACGSCGSSAPEIFEYDGEGLAENIFEGDGNQGVKAIPEDLEEYLAEAAESCPTECIKVADTPFN